MNKKLNRSTRAGQPTHLLIEILGWVGVVAIFSAYVLIVTQVVVATSPVYSLLNIFGSIAIVIESYVKRNYEPVVLNLLWALVALVALVVAWT